MCGLKWMTADSEYFRAAIEKTRACPDFRLACAKTMSTTRLDKQHASANASKEQRLKAGKQFGFLITSDGWRSSAKRQYHNYILVSVEGPIFLGLEEVTGQAAAAPDIKEGFKRQFEKLGADLTSKIVLGVTDTPSANRSAWRLLQEEYPKQIWLGCAAHEVSLLFKEWTKKIPDILRLFREGHRIVKWVNNHSEILKIYRSVVPGHFEDKRKHSLTLYSPGDTRMATVFKMLFRIKMLRAVLTDLVGRPDYEAASQKALKQWSDQQKEASKKLISVDGKYYDKVKYSIQSERFFNEVKTFIDATKSAMYLLRLVDGQSPVIGKFYYACCLVDKHLRVLKEREETPYIDDMRKIFMKRWKRWHRPAHTLAYALDPCYQTHELTREEKKDCHQVIRKMGGSHWADLKIDFDRWRNSSAIFPDEVWAAADKYHAYQWWASFGDDFIYLQDIAQRLLAQAISASVCEFNWRDVSQVVTKKTQRLGDVKLEKMVNTRAMMKLNTSLTGKVLLGSIPKLDDILDSMVNDAIAETDGGGDDVPDPDEMEDSDSEDDEEYNLMEGEDEDEAGDREIVANENLMEAAAALL